jgi:hypothetical protein
MKHTPAIATTAKPGRETQATLAAADGQSRTATRAAGDNRMNEIEEKGHLAEGWPREERIAQCILTVYQKTPRYRLP